MCKSCEVLYINGLKCHETGCPELYKDELRDCLFCGTKFTPEFKKQVYCSVKCWEKDYY